MELLNKFISEYATLLIYSAVTAIVGVIAAFVKKKYNEWANTRIKREVVKTCVMAVQQMYKELNGEEKKEKAVEAISDMLAEKGITITHLEINMLIEACVGEFKNVFYKTDEVEVPAVNAIGFECTSESEYADEPDEEEEEEDNTFWEGCDNNDMEFISATEGRS